MITVAERVGVPHPPDIVWSVLSDPSRVVACIDGSELGQFHDDGSFDARIAVKFAAIKVGFGARATLDLDDDQRCGRLEARGSDTRGSTRVQGNAEFVVRPATDGSMVHINGAIQVSGQLASLVTTGAAVVVDRMTRSFTARLAAACAELDPTTRTRIAVTRQTRWERVVRVLRRLSHLARAPLGRLRERVSGRSTDSTERAGA